MVQVKMDLKDPVVQVMVVTELSLVLIQKMVIMQHKVQVIIQKHLVLVEIKV